MVGVDNLLRSAVSRQVELRYGTLVSMEFTVVYGTAVLRWLARAPLRQDLQPTTAPPLRSEPRYRCKPRIMNASRHLSSNGETDRPNGVIIAAATPRHKANSRKKKGGAEPIYSRGMNDLFGSSGLKLMDN